MADKQKILAGRNRVDAYRTAHTKMHEKPWHKGVSEEHTPLLEAMVKALDGLGFTSTEAEFEPKKTEILAKFWAESDLQNIKELGFVDREDFKDRATKADKAALRLKWS